jgi:hypothetical protein
MRIKFAFLVIFIVLSFIGCNNDNGISLKEKGSTSILNKEGYFVKDGILQFNSGDDLYTITQNLSSMNNDERVSWEKSIGFVSLEREIELVYEEISTIETEKEYKKIADENSDILKLKDGLLEPIITSVFYSMIVNKDGFFIVNGTLHKVTEKGIYTDDNCCFENIDLVAKGLATDESIGFVSRNELHLKSGECGADDDEESNWSDARSCKGHILVERLYCKDGCCTHSWWYAVSAHSESWGRTLGIPYKYNSFHYCSGLEVKLNVPIVSSYNGQVTTFSYSERIFNTGLSYPNSDEKVHDWWKAKAIGDRVMIWNSSTTPAAPIPNPAMTQVKGTFWTRGSYPETAVVDCGYGY